MWLSGNNPIRFLVLICLACNLQAASYYVSSTGNDINVGSLAFPWLTLSHAIANVSDGDTINIVANGATANCDADVFGSSLANITIQSTALASFLPPGYRTNPTRDAAFYGRCVMSQGLNIGTESLGSNTYTVPLSNSTLNCGASDLASDTFTMSCTGTGMPNLANGSQIEFELTGAGVPPFSTLPTGLTTLTRYYIINCTGCTTTGGTFKVSATSGGSAITGLDCSGTCSLGAITYSQPLQVTAGSATITASLAPITWTNGTPVTFASTGLQQFGTLPAPLALETIYYVVNLSGRTFQVAASPGGTPIILTTIGTGPLQASNVNLTRNWKIRGIEAVNTAGTTVFGFFRIGNSEETSIAAMPSGFEFDRVYIHGLAGDSTLPQKGIFDNSRGLYVHDSWISNIFAPAGFGETQGIASCGSLNSAYMRNFIEAGTENIFNGGCYSKSGIANANKLFRSNYLYKPPARKITTSTGAASGPCWYDTTDTTDPDNTGGEWYHDTMGAQWYRCGSNGMWATTGTTPPAGSAIFYKDLAEHKNMRYGWYDGNLMNYSWSGGQSGEAWNNSNEPGSGPGMANDHIQITNNKVLNVYLGFVRTGSCNEITSIPCVYNPGFHTVWNNLIVSTPNGCGVLFNAATCGYEPYMNEWSQKTPPTQIAFNDDQFWHNTLFTADSGYKSAISLHYGGVGTGAGCPEIPYIDRALYQDSILAGDFGGECYATGGGELTNFFSNSVFKRIAMKASSASYTSVGATNTFSTTGADKNVFPANNAAIGYVLGDGTITGDYHLAAASPYSAANAAPTLVSADGTDLGADIDLINMMTSGAAAGTPRWDEMAGLNLLIGSTKAVLRYTAPTSAACTAKIYTTPVLNLFGQANLLATVLDSAAASISDGRRRELVLGAVTPLVASTQYWGSLACGGGVLIPFNFWTRATGGTLQHFSQFSSSQAVKYCTDKALSSGCTTTSASTSPAVPVATGALIYAQSTAGQLEHALVSP